MSCIVAKRRAYKNDGERGIPHQVAEFTPTSREGSHIKTGLCPSLHQAAGNTPEVGVGRPRE